MPPDSIVVEGAKYVRAYPVKGHKCQACGAASRVWTPARVMTALRKWNDRYGGPPKHSQWVSPPYGFPSSHLLIEMFGSWNAAIRAAGLRPRKFGGGQFVWSRETIIEAIQRWAREHGSPPTYKQWAQAAPERPGSRTVAQHFGSWNAALDAAGYYPRGSQGVRYTDLSHSRRVVVTAARPVSVDELRREAQRELWRRERARYARAA